ARPSVGGTDPVDVMLDRRVDTEERRRPTANSSATPSAGTGRDRTAPAAIDPAEIDPDRAQRSVTPSDLGRVRAVIEALPEAVFVTEPDGDLRLTNPAADRLFEDRPVQARSDLLGRFEELGPKRDRPPSILRLP